MNKQPVDYKQYDSRWANTAYSAPSGETARRTIRTSGCGPTCAAMVIASLKDKNVTPKETCAWSAAHGYKYANQGTAYSYFKPQLAAYGIECTQLLQSRIIHQPGHAVHDQVREYLAQGYWVIALMGPGTWTTGGHYVLVWDWDDKVRINDPNSVKTDKLNGDPDTFKNEVRMYWLVDARDYNIGNNEEDDDMDKERFKELWLELRGDLRDNDSSAYSAEAREWAVSNGLIQGGDPLPDGSPNYMWEDLMTREQLITVLYRFAKLVGLA